MGGEGIPNTLSSQISAFHRKPFRRRRFFCLKHSRGEAKVCIQKRAEHRMRKTAALALWNVRDGRIYPAYARD